MRFALLLIAAAGILPAQDPRQIVTEVQKRSRAGSQHYEGSLRVIDSGGRISDKRWTYDRIGSHGNSKVVIRFTGPAEVKGVALLVVNHPDRSADQWMWTPAINRERRIALQDRRTRFFGTDFSFEDLEERDAGQFDYDALADETIAGDLCWKIASTPRGGKKSQYTRSILWVRQKTYALAQIENFSGNNLIRRLRYLDMENVQGIWTAKTMDMEDLTRRSRTVLKLDSLRYNVPMQDEQFTLQALRRAL